MCRPGLHKVAEQERAQHSDHAVRWQFQFLLALFAQADLRPPCDLARREPQRLVPACCRRTKLARNRHRFRLAARCHHRRHFVPKTRWSSPTRRWSGYRRAEGHAAPAQSLASVGRQREHEWCGHWGIRVRAASASCAATYARSLCPNARKAFASADRNPHRLAEGEDLQHEFRMLQRRG